ncbi:hypothetical protein M0802_011337 [Mischocyttarus mexicanus]|nr:hypothetical protein M0802_011337 [Mischocyttarus mexicanus]
MTPKCPVSVEYPFALPRESHCYSKFWKTIGVEVAWVVVVLVLRTGVVKVPEIRLYWSKDLMFSNERIKSAVSQKRYFDILQHWHFSDSDQVCSNDRLFKINKRSVLMVTKCKYHKCSFTEITTRGHKTVRKPDCVISYHKAKKGVDISGNWCLRNWKFVTYS